MHTISVSEMKSVIHHLCVRKREPVMFWGQPGAGKTDGVVQSADEHKAHLCIVRLGQYDSVDIRGIPSVDEVIHLTTWNPPATLPFVGNKAFPDEGLIYLFLDEITSAIPAVFGVAYQLVNERGVGEFKLKDNVVIIAAGNRDGDRGVTNRMPLPLCNRLTHYEVGIDVEAWCNHAQHMNWPPIGIAFMNFRKELLSTFDPAKTDKAFATPRTWEKALDYYADKEMPEKLKQSSMAGAVGDGPSAEFWGFVDVWANLIPIAKIIKDPLGTELPVEASMGYALAVSISGSLDKKTIKPLHTYLKRMEPEYAVLAWKLALERDTSLFSAPEFLDFSKDYRAAFQ